jgi:hypothetical protein
MMWSGSIWLRIRTSGGLLAASEEGLSSVIKYRD